MEEQREEGGGGGRATHRKKEEKTEMKINVPLPRYSGAILNTGPRVRQVQDRQNEIEMADVSWLSFLAAQEGSSLKFAFISGRKGDNTPVSIFCHANFYAVDQDKSAER